MQAAVPQPGRDISGRLALSLLTPVSPPTLFQMSYNPTSGLPPVPGRTPEEVWEAIEHVAVRVGKQLQWPGVEREDLEQECRIECLALLRRGTFDPTRPLAAYLYVHCYRRTLNNRRKHYRRADPVCVRCHAGDYCTGTGTPCKGQAAWAARQAAKASLARPLDIDNVADAHEKRLKAPSDTETTLGAAELARMIDANLPVTLRTDYLAMLAGKPVAKARRKVVQAAILGIFARHNILLDEYKFDGFPEADLEAVDVPEPKVVRTPEAMARLNGLPEDEDQREEDDDYAADG